MELRRVYTVALLESDLKTFVTKALVYFCASDARSIVERYLRADGSEAFGIITRAVPSDWFEMDSNVLRYEHASLGGWAWLTEEDEAIFDLEWRMMHPIRGSVTGRTTTSEPNLWNHKRAR